MDAFNTEFPYTEEFGLKMTEAKKGNSTEFLVGFHKSRDVSSPSPFHLDMPFVLSEIPIALKALTCCSVTKLCPTLFYLMDCSMQASSVPTITWSLLKFVSIEWVMLSNHLIFCRPPCPIAFNLSQHQGLFQLVDTSHQVAKILELQHQAFQ